MTSSTSSPARAAGGSATLRVVVTLGALAVLVQAVLAGQILAGSAGASVAHGIGGQVAGLLGLVQLVVAIVAWRRGRAGGALAAISAVVFLALVGQVFAGVAGVLALHIPLGVLLFGGYGALVTAVWRR